MTYDAPLNVCAPIQSGKAQTRGLHSRQKPVDRKLQTLFLRHLPSMNLEPTAVSVVKKHPCSSISDEARERAASAWERNKNLVFTGPATTSKTPAHGTQDMQTSLSAASPPFSWLRRDKTSQADLDLAIQLDKAKKHGVNGKLMIIDAARQAATSSSMGAEAIHSQSHVEPVYVAPIPRVDIIEMTPVSGRHIVSYVPRSSIPRLTRQGGCDRLIQMYCNELLRQSSVHTEKVAVELIESSQLRKIAQACGAAHELILYKRVTTAKDYSKALASAFDPMESLLVPHGSEIGLLKQTASKIALAHVEELRAASIAEERQKLEEAKKEMEALAKEKEGDKKRKRQMTELFGSDSEDEDEEVVPDQSIADEGRKDHIQQAMQNLIALSSKKKQRGYVDPTNEVKDKIFAFVAAVLKPLFQAELVDRNIHKAVIRSCVQKLYESEEQKARSKGRPVSADFLLSHSETIRKFISAQTIHEKKKRRREGA